MQVREVCGVRLDAVLDQKVHYSNNTLQGTRTKLLLFTKNSPSGGAWLLVSNWKLGAVSAVFEQD